MNNKVIIPIIVGIIVLSLGISLHRISSKSSDLQYDFLSKTMAEPSGMESAGDKASGNYGKAEAFDAESSDAILFIERKITSLEPCRISAGSIILDIPVGAVSSEKDVTVRGLRDNELPALDYGLVNVTSTYGGYRCLPHGKFNKPLQLSIGYDTLLIPAGYSPHDIRTFFYDEDRMEWVCMPVDSIDQEHQLVVTSTDHFTDFINGILTQPEIPDASGYANTSIRGIEYANPLEGMNIMQAPTANNNGSCSMSFPIQIPAGRNGMAPQISISYSSDVKDGIMGPGWSLNIPSITVDTRWGVPPYSTTIESESYLVNGEAIVEDISTNENIITRRNPLYVEGGVNRGAEKKYAYLKEGRFDKIVRHGNSPQNYWWEVIDREGVQSIYGDVNNNEPSDLSHSLAGNSPDNNIAVWGLSYMKDLHGNCIKYNYEIDDSDDQYGAKQMRISNILYTSYEGEHSEEAPYEINFYYDEEATNAPLSAMYGFFTSDMRMLSKISVTYNGSFVKCYKFKYEESGSLRHGALPKKRLVAIAEITDRDMEREFDNWDGSQKQGLYVHTFDYYPEEEITFEGSSSLTISEGESPFVLGVTVSGERNISNNNNYSVTVGGSACAGFFDGAAVLKDNTAGANYHYTFDKNNQKAQLLDLNGDGVVDRIEKTAGDILFYKGIRNPNGRDISFDNAVRLRGNTIPRLGKSASHTHSIGSELLLSAWFVKGSIGYAYSRTKTINSDYFMDVNGDGFMDFVSDETVYLNFPNEEGIPQFMDWSIPSNHNTGLDNCYSFGYDGNVGITMVADSSESKRDPVVLWRSPMNCKYNFEFRVLDKKYEENPSIDMGVSYYKSEDSAFIDRWYKDCPHRFNQQDCFDGPIFVPEGGHILFHVHPLREELIDIFEDFSINVKAEGCNSRMVTEVGESIIDQSTTDADDKLLLSYDYGSDAVIQDGSLFIASFDGDIKWSASLGAQRPMSDDLKYSIIHNKYYEDHGNPNYTSVVIYSNNFRSGDAIGINRSSRLHVSKNDQLLFKLESNSNVDWSGISFESVVKYEEGSLDTITYHPSLDMSIYSRQICMSRPVRMERGLHFVKPDPDLITLINNHTDAEIWLTVKSKNSLNQKVLLVDGSEHVSFILNEQKDVYFDYTINGELDVPENVNIGEGRPFKVFVDDHEVPVVGAYAKYPAEKMHVSGNLYRGWGQVSYKDNKVIDQSDELYIEAYPYQPIPLQELKFEVPMEREDMEEMAHDHNTRFGRIIRDSDNPDENYGEDLENFVEDNMVTETTSISKFEPMVVDMINNAWADSYKSAFVKRNSIGSGSGMQTIMQIFEEMQNSNGIAEHGDAMPNFNNPLGSRPFPVINKVSRSISHSFSASVGADHTPGLGYNHTRTETCGLSDMMDMNGDGYPDIVDTRHIQYTLPNGDMSNNKFTLDEEHKDVYTSYSKGKSNGGSLSFKPSKLNDKSTNPKSTEKYVSASGLSNSKSENEVLSSYVDVNSDGLPDIVSFDEDDDRYYVEYNLGYKFSDAYPINITKIALNKGESSSLPNPLSNLMFNTSNYSFSGGVGSNANDSYDNTIMMDFNSDGLIDIASVRGNSSSIIDVYYNNGRGFVRGGSINIGVNNLSSSATKNYSVSGSGTVGFPIEMVKVTASAYTDFSYSFSNERIRIMDVNGDGAVDILKVSDSGISVRYGRPQMRNLLKKVTTPALGEYEMTYSMLYPDADNPHSKWLMSGLTVHDNDGDFEDGSDELNYQFEYAGMVYHRIERESYGFAEVTTRIVDHENSNVLRQQKEYYITENGLRHGLKYRDEVLNGRGNLQTRTDYNWTLNNLNTGEALTDYECGDSRDVYPRLKSELTTVFGTSSSNALTSEKQYEYGKYGNITKYTSNYKPNEYVMANMSYAPDRSRNLLNKLTYMTVRSHDGQLLREMRRGYNQLNGDIIHVTMTIEGENCPTEYEYDDYGNITKVTYPANNNGERTSYDYEYDRFTNTYISSVTDVFRCSTLLASYDYRFGKPTVVTAPNGTRTVYTYYSDGKVNTIKAPMDEDQDYSLKFEYWDELRNQSPRWARVIHKDAINEGNTFITQTVCDGLGRTMQTARKAVVNGDEKFVASGKNVYDDYGRVVKSYQSAEVSGNPNAGFLHASFENPTSYTYDCMDRVLTTITPDNKTIAKSYNVSNDAWGELAMLVTTIDPLGRVQKTYTDSRGLQTSTELASESGDIITKFKYSSIGELIASFDPEENRTRYKYDMLGRLVSREHPDAGTTRFTYDKAGNLVAKATQKLVSAGREINYTYRYNRLMEIHYPYNPEMDVYYEYGTSGLNKGLVIRRQDGVCVQSYSYNEMGDLVRNIRTFAMPNNRQLMTFKTEWKYDTWGRIWKMVYPDDEIVTYSYDNAGKANGMSAGLAAIVSDIKYDKYGNRTYIEYGNGAYNNYEYDATSLQLSAMSSTDADGIILQNVNYTYDDVYNITEINAGGEYPYIYNYQYDMLNRLVGAEGSSSVADNLNYNFAMSYSPAGRILNYSLIGNKLEDGEVTSISMERSYTYNSTKPHAPTHIAPTNIGPHFLNLSLDYAWDGNGNFRRCSGRFWLNERNAYFNDENRLAAIGDVPSMAFNMQTSANLASYLYDADGERVWRYMGVATLVYSNGQLINSDLELDKVFYPTQQVTFNERYMYKHYFVGSERVCTQTAFFVQPSNPPSPVSFLRGTASSFSAAMRSQVVNALNEVGYNGRVTFNNNLGSLSTGTGPRPKKFYYHYNHQGSVALVTNMSGRIQQHLQYLPYGGTFVDQHTSSFASPFTFSAKEKDAESGYNYFGARYYTDNIMMWLSVDPMSDERPWISPYNYCQWNPIGRVDTWGMLDAEWSIDKATGRITKLNDNIHTDANGNEVDVLFNSKGKSIEVSKNVLKEQGHLPKQSYVFKDVNEAENFYYFCAQSSDFEWTFADAMKNGGNIGMVGTDFGKGSTQMPSNFENQLGGNNIRRMSHSHPMNSAFGHPSYNVDGKDIGDINNAKQPSAFNYIREVYDVQHNRVYEYSRNTSIPLRTDGLGNDIPRYDRMRYINVDYR